MTIKNLFLIFNISCFSLYAKVTKIEHLASEIKLKQFLRIPQNFLKLSPVFVNSVIKKILEKPKGTKFLVKLIYTDNKQWPDYYSFENLQDINELENILFTANETIWYHYSPLCNEHLIEI